MFFLKNRQKVSFKILNEEAATDAESELHQEARPVLD
jgi:hypothetical protein